MIVRFDQSLRELLVASSDAISEAKQVGFQAPDDLWRQRVDGLGGPGLNVYLFDVREDASHRTGDSPRRRQGGTEVRRRYLHCRYLISAWAPSGAGAESGSEHRLLTDVARALFRQPRIVVGSDAGEGAVEAPLRLDETVGLDLLARFWAGMGPAVAWRPSLCLGTTLPVEWEEPVTESVVTEHWIAFRHQAGGPEAGEVRTHLGGMVRDVAADPPAPVAGATVTVETSEGVPLRTVRTDETGHFRVDDLPPGSYQVRWSAEGRTQPAPRTVAIPTDADSLALDLG